MNDQKKAANGGKKLPADLNQLKQLIDLMVDNDLSRLELREGDSHILLRRGGQPLAPAAQVPPPLPANVNPPAPAAEPAAPPAEADNQTYIRSPMVGTFYAGSEPDAPPFVTPGSNVTPDTVVCLLEAMKVFNEIKAEASGRITKVLVKNAEAVEYDQPLFAIAPA